MRSQKILFACLILISLTIATTYSPQLNVPIEQSTFQFQPPLVK